MWSGMLLKVSFMINFDLDKKFYYAADKTLKINQYEKNVAMINLK